MKTFVMGDIHGAHKALVQCLERSGFDKEKDTLIQLGDVVDGWSEVYECVEELLSIKNLIAIRGNHDMWFKKFLETGVHPVGGAQGSQVSIDSYYKNDRILNANHDTFFRAQHKYYIDEKNRLFVHGGFNRHYKINHQQIDYIYWWDRDLWLQALSAESAKLPLRIKDEFTEIFIGHTSTTNWKTTLPLKACNIWNLDTGGGFDGKVTIMDVDTKEYWQSDSVQELYNNEKGRN